MKILICGAGFGGLALAASLKKDGHDVRLVEKQEDHEVPGFVIGIWGNGLHTLEPFGVVDLVKHLSIPVTREVLRDKTGKVLAKINYQPLIDQGGGVFQLLHSDLWHILRGLTSNIPFAFETTITALEQRRDTVFVVLSNGDREEYDLVVGADGVHSQIRAHLFGLEGFERTNLRIWWTLLDLKDASIQEPNDLFGEGEYVGVFPARHGLTGVLFLATMHHEPEPPGERIALIRNRFADFGWLVPTVLEALQDQTTCFGANIEQVDLHEWHKGRIVLLGDAAHAVSPTTALGGAMALEDAHVLAEELRKVDATQIELALERYVARRRPRVAQVHHTSDFLIWLASMDSPTLTFMRKQIMHLLPSSFLLQGMGPIVETQA